MVSCEGGENNKVDATEVEKGTLGRGMWSADGGSRKVKTLLSFVVKVLSSAERTQS